MSNQLQPVIDYINRVSPSGITKIEITNQLLGAGWTIDDINNAFIAVGTFAVPVPAPSTLSIQESLKFATINKWLIFLITLRLILIPVQYFFIPLLVSMNTVFGSFLSPGILNLSLMGAILPLLWFFPLFSIRKKQRSGYKMAIFFAVVLIFLNISGLLVIFSFRLQIFSLIYVVTGIAIIIFASRALKLLPSKQEFSTTERSIKKSGVIIFAGILAILFGCIMFLISFLTFGHSMFGDSDISVNGPIVAIIAPILGAIIGYRTAYSLTKDVQLKRSSSASGHGAFYGALLGAVAQLPLYGLNPIQIIAMPIGGMIGAVVGLIASFILYYILEKVLVE